MNNHNWKKRPLTSERFSPQNVVQRHIFQAQEKPMQIEKAKKVKGKKVLIHISQFLKKTAKLQPRKVQST